MVPGKKKTYDHFARDPDHLRIGGSSVPGRIGGGTSIRGGLPGDFCCMPH